MPTFMILARFTDETAMGFAEQAQHQTGPLPAAKLFEALKALAREGDLDGRLEKLYFTAGDPDMVLVLRMPNQAQAVAYAFAITHRLGVRTTTLPAFDVPEMDDVIKVAPKVGGP